MTQAGPLALTPSSSLAPASGWLAQIGTFVLLAGVGLLVLPPLLYLAAAALKAGELGAVTIGSLVSLAAMTLSLATLATIWAMLLALPLAWLVVRTDLPFRNLCRWLAVIPLAIPSYIGAMSYIALLGPVGSVNTWLSSLIGAPQQWVNIYGFWGGVFVLGLFTYPYIFLLVSAALEATNPSIEETARSLGDRKSTRLNSSHLVISYAVFCLKKKKKTQNKLPDRTVTSRAPDEPNHEHLHRT